VDKLLPFYERELGFLRRYSREFSDRYPKIASRLLMMGEVCEDPHIERMIQSFALLNSRISKRLDDDYPEFTEALFEVLYPQYLQSFPSCSIACMTSNGSSTQLTTETLIPRGTELTTRLVKGVACKFKTVFDVNIAPLCLSQVKFDPIIESPESVHLPRAASAKISITIETTSEQANFTQLNLESIRAFIDGEPSFCAGLRDTLFMRMVAAYVEEPSTGQWIHLNKVPLTEVGFSEEEALIPFSARSHPAYRLLTEYFAFPEKFNFFGLDMQSIRKYLSNGCKKFTLHLVIGGIRSDSNLSRMLGSLSLKNVLLGCTPVINSFRQRGDPIRLTHTATSYPVVADSRRAFGYEILSIDSVKLVRQTPDGESVTHFRPFYSLRHGETPEKKGHYWVMRRNEIVASKSPGYETEISIVDIDFNPAAIQTDTLSIDLTCCNRDLPALLAYGMHDGDLFLEGGSILSSIKFLRKPTLTARFERGRGAHWRLISHLSLNHLSLTEAGLEGFQEMLRLYDLPRSPISQRQIASIVAIEHKAANAWLPGNPFACLVRGIEIRLTIDDEGFVGSGVEVFAQIVNRFLGLYVHANSFTRLIIISKRTGEELLRCLPRSGDLPLA
jgi:type VI secretion system protein ImpG